MSDKLFLWVEKYRPKKIDECILPDATRRIFQGFLEQGEIPNLLLAGTAGVGKTTVAKALCEELGTDCLVINGSDEGRFLDTVRNQAKVYASTVSLTSTAPHKVIIIDEADNTTPDVQLSLRTAVEEFHNNCRFIFTCNFPNKIIDPLHSRCTVINFKISNEAKMELQGSFFQRIKFILEDNDVKYQDKVIAKLVTRFYPDWRRLINETQRYAASGEISAAVLADVQDINIDGLMKAMKNKEFMTVRKWTVDNLNNEPDLVYRKIYDACYNVLKGPSIPEAVLIVAKYLRDVEHVPDQEINLLACLTELMMSCEFK